MAGAEMPRPFSFPGNANLPIGDVAQPCLRQAGTPGCALRFSDDATSIVILSALSDFAKGGRRLCLKPAEACLPQAGISPGFLSVLCASAVGSSFSVFS